MGLDGISINQLRTTPEFNSAELNRINSSTTKDVKVVDGLSNGQRVDPDKESEHENSQPQNKNLSKKSDDTDETIEINVEKYDLSDVNKYALKLDDESNSILIIEKNTSKIVQIINAQELSKLISYTTSSCGSIINRKL